MYQQKVKKKMVLSIYCPIYEGNPKFLKINVTKFAIFYGDHIRSSKGWREKIIKYRL